METLGNGFGTLAGALWSVSIQIVFLVAVIWVIDRLAGRSSPLFRYWLWGIVLIRLCIPFTPSLPNGLESLLAKGSISIMTDIREMEVVRAITSDPGKVRSFGSLLVLRDGPAAVFESASTGAPEYAVNPYMLVWFGTTALLGILVMGRIFFVHRLMRRSRRVDSPPIIHLLNDLSSDFDISRRVEILTFDDNTFEVPATFGILHPRIVLPRCMVEEWNAEELRPILLHELAHIRRYDLVVNWLQLFVQAVYFFHPLVWYTNRRLRELREEICDDIAVDSLGNDRKVYSSSILRVMERLSGRYTLYHVALCLSSRKSKIGRRIQRIMSRDYTVTTRLPVFSVVVLAFIACAGFVLSCAQTVKYNATSTAPSLRNDAITIPVQGELNAGLKEDIGAALVDTDNPPPVDGVIGVGLVKIAGVESSEPAERSVIGLVQGVDRYTNLAVKVVSPVQLDSDELLSCPAVLIAVDRPFSLNKAEKRNMGAYLKSGGFIILDNCAEGENKQQVEASLELMLKEAAGNKAAYYAIEKNHPLFHCFFDFDSGPPWGRIIEKEMPPSAELLHRMSPLECLFINGSLSAVTTDRGYSYRWREPHESAPQIKFGVNMIVYALFREGGMLAMNVKNDTNRHTTTKRPARQIALKFEDSNNVKEGSVRVILNDEPLKAGTDYTIDFDRNELILLTPDAADPRADLEVRYVLKNEDAHSVDINIFDTGGEQAVSPNDARDNRLSVAARVDYEDGTKLYVMNTSQLKRASAITQYRVKKDGLSQSTILSLSKDGASSVFTLILEEPGNVTVEVFDNKGRSIERIVDGAYMNEGKNRVLWDISGYHPGFYFIKTICGARENTSKIIIVD